MIGNMYSRRRVLAGTAALAAATAVARPRLAAASTEDTEQLVGKLTGGAAVKDGRVSLQTPLIAENGNTVPFTISVDSPMTAEDHVKAIHVFAEGNPQPAVASFFLGPDAGRAEVSLFMRLAKTQNVRALAVMSDGSAWQVRKEVKVTIGGCGG